LWPVLVDPAQMDEAILNLAINARDAMPEGGVLSIETVNTSLDADYAARNSEVVPGDYVEVSISDTGTGMTPEVIERCFEPFFTTKEVQKGTGLGLSMVYGFVKQSGGHVKVYSELGHGTSIKLYMPRAGEGGRAAPAAEPVALPPQCGSELVLTVEDNPDLRKMTVKQLIDLGYRTMEAENANAALQILTAHPEIDLLFTDVIMPGGMTGTELARAARQLRPRLKILLVSGYALRATASGAQDIAGLELLSKPFRKHDLARKLRHILDGE
jgi:CheY-like chemotaxis protein